VYGQAHDTPVTLHLTCEKWQGGQFGNKPESWAEIISLFPHGAISLQVHNYKLDSGRSENGWLAHLKKVGIDAELYYYADHRGEYESVERLDISPYLARIPRISAEHRSVELPCRFCTVQWDSTQRGRTITPAHRDGVLARYRADGIEPVVVGGEAAQKNLRWSLKDIAYAMSEAEFHAGVDSAFMHMAMLYMPMDRIHLYNEPDGFYSHHALRARDNGAPFNQELN